MATAAVVAVIALSLTDAAAQAATGDQVAMRDLAGELARLRTRAATGDADAEYRLGQAYRRGDGVTADVAQAESWYQKAADQGYAPAQAQLGLMLFTSPRRTDSFPWLEKAAAQGEPRAQYVLGTALFNGDGVAKDWPRAYAMMSRAAAGGLDPATRSLATMEGYLPLADKQKGATLASAIAARETAPAAVRVPPAPAPAAASAAPPARGWRVQLGAFGQEEAARAYWNTVSRAPALAGLTPLYAAAAGVTRLQAGPFAGKAAANSACAAVRRGGKACILVAP